MKIIYRDLDASWNCCDRKNNIIFTDKNLLDYPLAHEYIVEHELEHMRIGDNVFKQLRHEFMNDLHIYLSLSDEAVELREYIDDHQRIDPVGGILNSLRKVWMFLIFPFEYIRKLLQ